VVSTSTTSELRLQTRNDAGEYIQVAPVLVCRGVGSTTAYSNKHGHNIKWIPTGASCSILLAVYSRKEKAGICGHLASHSAPYICCSCSTGAAG
jgi:hypothetical protein